MLSMHDKLGRAFYAELLSTGTYHNNTEKQMMWVQQVMYAPGAYHRRWLSSKFRALASLYSMHVAGSPDDTPFW